MAAAVDTYNVAWLELEGDTGAAVLVSVLA